MATCIKISANNFYLSEEIYDAHQFFYNASPATLMQELFHSTKQRIFKRTFLAEELQMEYQMINAISTNDVINDIIGTKKWKYLNPSLSAIIDDCIFDSNCTALKSKMETIGKYKII